MTPRTLPQELVALVHHVELNRSGWWQDAIQRLFLSFLADGVQRTVPELVKAAHDNLGVNVSEPVAQKAVGVLCDSGRAVRIGEATYKASETARAQILKAIQECQETDRRAQSVFDKLMAAEFEQLPVEEPWQLFRDDFLLPTIRALGASAYNMLSRGGLEPEQHHLGVLLDRFDAPHRDAVRRVTAAFLAGDQPDVRALVLGHLNAHFFTLAANLSQEDLEGLTAAMAKKPRFAIFVDTNFLFSLLGLHENPANEASSALVELLQSVSHLVDVKLYVTPRTLDEARRVLRFSAEDLKRIPITKNVIAAIPAHELGGIGQAFIESARANTKLTVDGYFGPYIESLLTIARSRGVELYNASMDSLGTAQAVVDDINAQMEYEARSGRKRKTYEQHSHDVPLWHFVSRLRPAGLESPLDAGAWIVTVDYRFMGFDRFKSRMGSGIPVCLHPSVFVQFLQFWVPRDPKLDAALFASLSLRTSFYDFNPEAERATVKILQTLSRFENVADLPTPTVAAVLMNEALRARIVREDREDSELALVQSALIEANKRAQEALDLEARQLEAARAALKQSEREVRTLSTQVQAGAVQLNDSRRKLASTEEKVSTLEEQLAQERRERQDSEARSKAAAMAEETEREKGKARRRSWLGLGLIATVTAVVGALSIQLGEGQNAWQRVVSSSVAIAVAFGVARFLASRIVGVQRLQLLREPMRWLCGGK